MTCVLCRDKLLPGFTCLRCGTKTPGTRPVTGNKGAHGKAVNNRDIREALAGLTDLARRRKGKHEASKAAADLYAEQLARHVQHPQSRGSARRLMSKP
jgi:hypothetical protein